MGRYESRFWPGGGIEIGLPASLRKGGNYEAYIPDRLADRAFVLEPSTAAHVEAAALAIARLNASATPLVRTESLARLLLRAESVASSRIEGLEIGPRRLLLAEADESRGRNDKTANEVLANVEAMAFATGEPATPITIERILEVHRRLLTGTRLREYAGRIRETQSWIGASDYSPIGAKFIPPPPEYVAGLLDDLIAFCQRDDISAVIQAAAAHAQFETIHPFVDGNGRTGRALIYMVLANRGLADRVLPPISLALATDATSYIGALAALQVDDTNDVGWNVWFRAFASAAQIAVARAEEFNATIEAIQQEWRTRLPLRRGSTAEKLIERLPEMPVITATSAANLLQRSPVAARAAIQQLLDAGILAQVGNRKWSRTYETRDIIDAFTGLERALAVPGGNTMIEKPRRRVPQRPSPRSQ